MEQDRDYQAQFNGLYIPTATVTITQKCKNLYTKTIFNTFFINLASNQTVAYAQDWLKVKSASWRIAIGKLTHHLLWRHQAKLEEKRAEYFTKYKN